MKFTLGRRSTVLPRARRPEGPIRTPDAEAEARRRVERVHEQFPERHDRIAQQFATFAEQAGITGGRVLELRGRRHDHGKYLPPGMQYLHLEPPPRESGARRVTVAGVVDGAEPLAVDVPDDLLDPEEPAEVVTDPDEDAAAAPDLVVADIAHCPELESGSFDVVVSVDVLEHLPEPWLAAQEIVRLLRPGGFTYHNTLFSWRYHPEPADYWRFTPDALTFLFEDLDLLRCDFDAVERRRNLVGRGRYRLEQDAFGGWRENWRVFYAGVKPLS